MGRRTSQDNLIKLSRGKTSVRLWLRMLSCEVLIERRLRILFKKTFDVTLPQFDVLAELEHAGKKLTMSQLSKELMVSNGNVTGIVDRLEKNSFISRSRPSHDRRVQFIELTMTGEREFKRMAARHEEWQSEYFSGLSVEDMNELQLLLVKVRESILSARK